MTARTFNFTVQAAPPPGASLLQSVIYGGTFGGTPYTAMAANSWRRLPATFPSDANGAFFYENGNGVSTPANILDYSHRGYYDATRNKVFHIGASYSDRCWLVTYNVATNVWSRVTIGQSIIHSFDHLGYDPATGYLYFYEHHGLTTYRVNVDTATISTVATGPWAAIQDTSMAQWFAANNQFVAISRYGDVRRLVSGAWQNWTSDGGGDRGYSTTSAYSSQHGVMFYGGGTGQSTTLRAINATGQLTTITTNGPSFYFGQAFLACDPVSGQLLIFNRSTQAVSKLTYNGTWPPTNSFSTISTLPSGSYHNPVSGASRMFVAPLTGLDGGASAVLVVNGDGYQAWIYRYS